VIERSEWLVPGPAEALAGLLDVPLPDLDADGLPPLWHWVYLLERPPQAILGEDGHPATGGIPSPPAPGLRRMFAGGRVTTHGPLRVGRPATRRSAVVSETAKQGRAGRLTFVTVSHEISQDGRVVVAEEQDIVYREPVDQPLPVKAPEDQETGGWEITVDPVLLFRFSALTYNGHRIHYDRGYARAEGYPGLVVHGPLQALAMAEAARRHEPTTRFAYRLVSPLFDDQGMVVRATRDGEEIRTAVHDRAGRTTAIGTAGPAGLMRS
jgi:3-methylfumaryl-CoA hydratase